MKKVSLDVLKHFLDVWYESIQSNIPVEIIEEAVEEIEEFDFINIKENLLQSLKETIEYEKKLNKG